MKKRFCDRCGAEINPRESASYVYISYKPISTNLGLFAHITSELCVSCAYHLKQWLKGGAEE